MEKVMARGPNFIYARDYIKKTYGESVWDAALSKLSQDDAKVWSAMLVPEGTYPFVSFKAMTRVLSDHIGANSAIELSKMYEYIADCSLNGLFKFILQAVSPSFVISQYPMLWSKFFTTGDVSVPVARKGYAEVMFILPEVFLDWLPPACHGYSTKAVKLAGASNLEQREISSSRRLNGEWEIIYGLKWNES
jgi:hypothetical protein